MVLASVPTRPTRNVEPPAIGLEALPPERPTAVLATSGNVTPIKGCCPEAAPEAEGGHRVSRRPPRVRRTPREGQDRPPG
jgi:hypothetical protein